MGQVLLMYLSTSTSTSKFCLVTSTKYTHCVVKELKYKCNECWAALNPHHRDTINSTCEY